MSIKTLARSWAAVAALACAGLAHAELITFEFTGTTVYSTYLGVPGTPVTGTFSYDPQTEPFLVEGGGNHREPGTSAYNLPPPAQLVVRIGSHTIQASDQLGASVYNNNASNIEDFFTIGSVRPVIDGTTLIDGGIGLNFASKPGQTNALKDTRLPRQLHLQRFDTRPETGNVLGYVQANGSSDGMILQFTIDSVRRKHH